MAMRKTLKIYLWSWVVVIALLAILIVLGRTDAFAFHHRLAKDPTNIEKITKLDLPEIAPVDSRDNLERSSSCWDCFEHRSYFTEKLSDDCIQQLDYLCLTDSTHWSKDEANGYYAYLDDAWNRGGRYCISCRIYDDYSYVEYYVDESEGIGIVIAGIMVLMVFVYILLVYGITMLGNAKLR